MKRFCITISIIVWMFLLVACANHQDGSQNSTDAPSMSETEGENLGTQNLSTEIEDDTNDSTEEVN